MRCPIEAISTDGDVGDHSSEADRPFDFDRSEEGSSPSRKPDQPQPRVMLNDLIHIESIISQIRDYSFEHEKSQWTEDKLDSFLNPPSEMWNLDDPQLRLSFKTYLSLSAHSSEATHQENTTSLENHLITLDGLQVGLKRISRSNYVLLEDTCTSDFHLYKLCLLSPPQNVQ